MVLVLGNITVDPIDKDVSWRLGSHRLGIPIMTDGGMWTGSDVNKVLVSDADAVMLGSPYALLVVAGSEGWQ